MKCIDCEHKSFWSGNGDPNRYYCLHPEAVAGRGAQMICRTDRHSTEIKIKTSPKWCPLRQKERDK
jgi:hypothetical protein